MNEIEAGDIPLLNNKKSFITGAPVQLSGITLGYEHWFAVPWVASSCLSEDKNFFG